MTLLNAPGLIAIPSPAEAKADKKGRTTHPVVLDTATALRALALGFWLTTTKD